MHKFRIGDTLYAFISLPSKDISVEVKHEVEVIGIGLDWYDIKSPPALGGYRSRPGYRNTRIGREIAEQSYKCVRAERDELINEILCPKGK